VTERQLAKGAAYRLAVVGAEKLIRRSHAASSYSWMRSPSLSILRSCFASGHHFCTGTGALGTGDI